MRRDVYVRVARGPPTPCGVMHADRRRHADWRRYADGRWLRCLECEAYGRGLVFRYHAPIGSCMFQAPIGSCGFHAASRPCGFQEPIGSCGFQAPIGSCGFHAASRPCGFQAPIGSCGFHAASRSCGSKSNRPWRMPWRGHVSSAPCHCCRCERYGRHWWHWLEDDAAAVSEDGVAECDAGLLPPIQLGLDVAQARYRRCRRGLQLCALMLEGAGRIDVCHALPLQVPEPQFTLGLKLSDDAHLVSPSRRQCADAAGGLVQLCVQEAGGRRGHGRGHGHWHW